MKDSVSSGYPNTEKRVENRTCSGPGCILCRLRRRSSVWISKVCGVLAFDRCQRVLTGIFYIIMTNNLGIGLLYFANLYFAN